MNIENIQKIVDMLKADDGSHFLMSEWVQWLPHVKEARIETVVTEYVECGTACCIAGWANMIRLGDKAKELRDHDFRSEVQDRYEAREWLGIDDDVATELFQPGAWRTLNYQYEMDAIDRLPANQRRLAGIAVLENLIQTGEADWPKAIEFAKTQ